MNTKIILNFIRSAIVSLFLLLLFATTPQSLYAYNYGYVDINANPGTAGCIQISVVTRNISGVPLTVDDFNVRVSILGGADVFNISLINTNTWLSTCNKLVAGQTYVITTNTRKAPDPRVHTSNQFTLPAGTTRKLINYNVLHTNNQTLFYKDDSPANNQMLDSAAITRKFYARPWSGIDIDYILTSNIEYSTSGGVGTYSSVMSEPPFGSHLTSYNAVVAGDQSVTLPQITIPNAKDGFYRWRVERYLDQETPIVSLFPLTASPLTTSRYWSGESDYAEFRLRTDITAEDEPIVITPSQYTWLVYEGDVITFTGTVTNDSDTVTARQSEAIFRLDKNYDKSNPNYNIVLGTPIAAEVPPGGAVQVTSTWTAELGLHRVQFCINRNNVLFDRTDTDDCITKIFRVERNPGPPDPLACDPPKVESVITLDKSLSMQAPASPVYTQTKLSYSKTAAQNFVKKAGEDLRNEMAVVAFARNGEKVSDPLINDWLRVFNNIYTINFPQNPGTCIVCGINDAGEIMDPKSFIDGRNIIILVSDGAANWIESGQAQSHKQAMVRALRRANIVNGETGSNFYVIGVGDGAKEGFLQRMAFRTGGKYYPALSYGELDAEYKKIFDDLTGASAEGTVFQDDNQNGIFEPGLGEKGSQGWTITRTDTTNGDVATDISDIDGLYDFGKLCVGHVYEIKETTQARWEQTAPTPVPPAGPGTYTISPATTTQTISNLNFGNYPNGKSLSGEVFVDTNSDGVKDPGENTYNGAITITVNPPDAPATYPGNGKYLFNKTLDETEYYVTYSGIPAGFTATVPNPTTFHIKLGLGGPGCGIIPPIPPGAALPTCDAQGNMTGLNFGITDLHVWYQAYGLNARLDQGVTNLIPQAPSIQCGGGYMMTNKPFSSANAGPGILFTGDNSADFGKGKVSLTGWIAGRYGGSPFGEKYAPPSGRLRASYAMMLSAIQQRGIEIKDMESACGGGGGGGSGLGNCELKNNLQEGVYKAEGAVTINKMEHLAPGQRKKITFLINGKLTINATQDVPRGSVHIFVASDDIHVTKDIGQANAACPSTTSLEGIFITDESFVVEGYNNCAGGGTPDRMLNVAGAVVINAGLKGGSLEIQRTLCGQNATIPTFIVQPRLDMILNLPDYLKTDNFIWREVAP